MTQVSGEKRNMLLFGSTGAVGGGCLDVLAHCDDVSLVIAGRDETRLRAVASSVPADVQCARVDLADAADASRVAALVARCDVVINCAGPSQRLSARIAQAAIAAGVPYVDPGGDQQLWDRLATAGTRVPVVLQAGVQPGLSGLILRVLALGREIDGVTAWCGGLQRLTPASALEYVASLHDTHSHPGAALRGGQIRRIGHDECRSAPGQYFPGSATARAHLDAETVAVAAQLGIGDVSWMNVFDGAHTTRAMHLLAIGDERPDGHADLESVLAAAKLDVFGRRTYFAIVATGHGVAGATTVAFTCPDSYRSTGALAGYAAHRVTGMTAGVHPFWSIDEPRRVLDFLTEAVPGSEFSVVHDTAEGVGLEEGSL